MLFLNDGKVRFTDRGELLFHLFMEMGLGINSNQYLYDQDTGEVLRFKDLYIKADVNNQPIYAGKTDIVFEPETNYSLMNNLFAYYLEKFKADEDNHITQEISYYFESDPNKEKQRIFVKTQYATYATQFYSCVFLAFIEATFLINGNFMVDLSNFDIVPVK